MDFSSVVEFLRAASVDFLLGCFTGVVAASVFWFFILRARMKEYREIIASKDREYKSHLSSKDLSYKTQLENQNTLLKNLLENKDSYHKEFLNSKNAELEAKDKSYQSILDEKDKLINQLHIKIDNLNQINKALAESSIKAIYGISIDDIKSNTKT